MQKLLSFAEYTPSVFIMIVAKQIFRINVYQKNF